MKKILIAFLMVAGVLSAMSCASTKGLSKFGAEMGKKSVPVVGTVRIPYTSVMSYYGYVKPGAKADAEVNGKKMFYLYVWIPAVAPELGLRMVSPAPEGMTPAEGDFVGKDWEEGKADKSSFFDTWISWERSAAVLKAEDIVAKGKAGSWLLFDSNDDSSEMPKNPAGRKYNSLLRIVSDTSDPAKSLIRGLYRIAFTTYKTGEVKGSFLAQVGAPINIPGVVVGASLEEVMAKATEASN